MCGRTRCTLRVDDVSRACGFQNSLPTRDSERYRPSYNVSPGSYMPVVCKEDMRNGREPHVHCMKWGLVPSFTKKNEKPDHFRMFNARSESVREKASFRRLLPSCRCLVALEGFYEWKKDGAKKQPFYIHFQDERPLVFAALYDRWEDSEGGVLFTFTILTTRSSKAFQWLHDRMPVILGNKDAMDAWLNSDLSSLPFDMVTQSYEASDLVWYPVTPAMGRTV
uniref:TSA: Wollemia nobilis Ref_Wollemi_Transcript_25098_1227 transcribed RNA sequence n=1 Tax=Wollemia nobilis TaxID=56998 RepID=A0A0C9RQI2_9CONI